MDESLSNHTLEKANPSASLLTYSTQTHRAGSLQQIDNPDEESCQDGTSIYDSALDSLTEFKSFNESANNNSLVSTTTTCSSNWASPLNSTSDISDTSTMTWTNANHTTSAMSPLSAEEDSSCQEEVDPKTKLAQKTIFKTENPNLSIIEINDDVTITTKNTPVYLVDSPQLTNKYLITSLSPNSATTATLTVSATTDKRRKKPESLLHASKQKLDLTIAEASASDDTTSTSGIETSHSAVYAAKGKPPRREVCGPDAAREMPLPVATKRDIPIYNSLEEFDKNLPSTVTKLDTPFGSRVYLVGTAHFSEDSQDDVSYVIRNVRPDIVMVELCPSRVHILKLDEKTLLEEAKSFNIPKIRSIIQSHGYINGIFFMLLLQMSAQMAKDLGMAPGGEFRRAFEEIHRLPGCVLQLGDRPIRITLHRALRALSLWQTMKLVWRLTSTESISIEEVEECKQSDLLEKLMQEMAGEFPAFSDVFVKERDMYLCHSLQLACLPQPSVDGGMRPVTVVGVVGIGHANGIAKMWGEVDPTEIPKIMKIPPASLSTRIFTNTMKYGIIGLIGFGAYKFLRPRLPRLF